MLVHPTYKDYWDIPGGYVEPGETPYEACVREAEEELGIRPTIRRLLVADWASADDEGDKILFIFDGGRLTDDHHAAIKLQDGELFEYRYVSLSRSRSHDPAPIRPPARRRTHHSARRIHYLP